MNERIREIAVKAGMSQINRRSDGFYVVSEKAFELFATELIRECATFVNNVMPVYSKDELDLCKRTAKQMKMYFGVKK
jgi:hypothetical protein